MNHPTTSCGAPESHWWPAVGSSPLPSDHPPTLFLHGGQDDIVPIATAQAYEQDLVAQGIATKFVAGHDYDS